MTWVRAVRDDARVAHDVVSQDLLASIADDVRPALVAFAFVRGDDVSVWPSSLTERLFHIGSITKTFTALLLADMVEAREVSLADPVGVYLSGAVGCADVTLRELATHTSGLPQLPDPLAGRGAQCPHDPYSVITEADMLEAARLARPGRGRGEFVYSNFGYALLGLVLAAAAGAPFESLLRRRVLDRLGLHDTIFDVDADDRLVDGHALSGVVVPHWHNPAMAGCGSLLSSAADMGRYLLAQVRPDATGLRAAIEVTHRPLLRRGNGQWTALGWVIDKTHDGLRYWHNGGTSGFSAYAVFDPAVGVGVGALMSQTPSTGGRLEALGNSLLARLST